MSKFLEYPAALRTASPFSQAAYCWVANFPPGRNQFVSFERRFRISTRGAATLHLFADTRYRLFINERFVAYGPGRFITTHPEFDTYALGDYLQPGENLIRVEVNYYGCPSFQTMPDGLPGFIADGGTADGQETFETPGEWLSRIHRAWSSDAPHFSFAQNPSEICDTRVLAAELSNEELLPVVPLGPASTPWGKLVPRSAPYPDYMLRRPKNLLVAGPLMQTERWGLQLLHPAFSRKDRSTHPRYVAFITWIHSYEEQIATMDCFWSELFLNGQPLELREPGMLGNHREATLSLRKGWNFLAGNVELLTSHWPLLLGFPSCAQISLHAKPDLSCDEAFGLSPILTARFVASCPSGPGAFRAIPGWSNARNDLLSVTPARLVAWDQPAPSAVQRDIPIGRFAEVASITARAAVWSFDFALEYYGHALIEVEAPAGTILDIAYDDWRRVDGCVNLYHSNPYTDTTDRFILRGGRQQVEVLNPRGGIFLQVILRAPVTTGATHLAVHNVGIRRRTTINTLAGDFRCGHEVLDWTWRTSIQTLQASTDEAYADCPWRERGSYIGDTLVNLHLHRLVSADLSVARRTLSLFGNTQRPDGLVMSCAPSWLDHDHGDFSLIWVQAVRDFWALTGDLAFAATQWPVIERILNSPAWKPDADNLWSATDRHIFMDWGALHSERVGPANTYLNIMRVAAHRAAAELAGVLNLPSAVLRHGREAAAVSRTLSLRLWDDKEGSFFASRGATTPAIHANVMALRHGIGPADRILAYLEPKLRANFTVGCGSAHHNGFVELYFFHYLLPALALHSRYDLAESLIEETYGFLKSLGYQTLVECFHRASQRKGSCCHSWSGSPAVYASTFILGLRQTQPGKPDAFTLDPVSSAHHSAQGVLPHTRGSIRLRWERRGDRIHARATLPPGVTLAPAAHVDLTID
ncbi:family 78 glycoside hydrolase catalytic domain [Rariglobus hedericola]|uniref:Bacterial alpha-L-rhamnosidase n=1 Tax=Rariglobus hedericola TaxID=2597822 RepID=A0A556QPF0_9BACT|nr:family 78 glycoside hydrolase catalytic domain [Rariglobus hedericola]TSJ78523.1 Bacterial alpha-L-rhamnosidase [Rariglobus hedericola]